MSNESLGHEPRRQSFWERNRKSHGMLLKRTAGQGVVSVVRGLLLFGLCFMIIQPLLMKLSVSLMTENDLYDTTVTLLPRHLTWANYELAARKSDTARKVVVCGVIAGFVLFVLLYVTGAFLED